MGTRDASNSFLKTVMAKSGEARRRRRGKRRVLEHDEKDNEEDGAERRGKARRREAAAVAVEAMAMGMLRRWGVCSALRRRRVVVVFCQSDRM